MTESPSPEGTIAERGTGGSPPSDLADLVDRLVALAERRLATRPASEAAARRARQLRDHLVGHLRPRSRSLDAPLFVAILGPTGAGKSSLFNTLAGAPASETGVLRPTTRELLVRVPASGRRRLLEDGPLGALAALGPDRLRVLDGAPAPDGIALADTPDIDSIVHQNRALADRVVEAADLAIFVTTAARYADRTAWDVLARARDRGLPLLVVVNRLPPDGGAGEVLADLRRLLVEAGLGEPDLVAVSEGALDPSVGGLDPTAVAPVARTIERLAADRERRRSIAARALAGAVAGLDPLLERVADDLEHEAIDTEALRRTAHRIYGAEIALLRDAVHRGSFLREETLRRWHAYVGTDQLTQLFATGLTRLRAFVGALVGGAPPAPVAAVRETATSDLVAATRLHAGEAASRTAAAWSVEPAVARAVAADPSLWSHGPGLDERLSRRLDAWLASIGADIERTGERKRRIARGASIGVSTLGIAVMLATFSHTGGLTGAEVGIAAATAVLNQKLLEALFGEATMAELVRRARERLDALLGDTLLEDLDRFERLVVPPGELRSLAHAFRSAADEIRRLAPALPDEVRAVMVEGLTVRPGSGVAADAPGAPSGLPAREAP